ncbi:hypothetical protein ACFY93_22310 [Streptomyces sp. NPDC008313]|uniref:hypothetical protein n=1 Tax=Streptomyces sp. NPDC008313 TaxID=3364826 RepID=UPI0036E82E6A
MGQLSALIGVVVGAAMSYLVGALHERARWRREQGARWDGLLLEAYGDYGRAVKECVVAYQRLASDRGLTPDSAPGTGDALEDAAQAELRRAATTEPLRLLAGPDAAAAVRELNDAVWHLEWLARGRLAADAAAWEQAYGAYRSARRAFYEKARASLRVPGEVIAERAAWPPSWRAGA